MATNVINMRRFVDVSTGVQSTPANIRRDWGAVLFVQKGQDGATTTLTKYDDLASVIEAGSNTEAAKAAQVFYGTKYSGYAATSPFYVAVIGAADVAEFTTNFTALMGSEEYYLVALDANFDVATRKAAASAIEATSATAEHFGFLEDYSAEAANLSLEDDKDSLGAYCRNNRFTRVMIPWVNPSNTNKYYGLALAAFFASRRFVAGQRVMCSVAHKAATGIEAVAFDDPAITIDATSVYDNLKSKNMNVYGNVKIIGLTAWENGDTPSGDDASDYISAAYLDYTITMSVWSALQTNPRIPMNNDGAVILASAIELAFMRLSAAGIITGGTSLDGETFPASGYKISIPIPTGVAKANGLWENIACSALLAGSTKKVVIGNILKR